MKQRITVTTESGAEYEWTEIGEHWWHRGYDMGVLRVVKAAEQEPVDEYPFFDSKQWATATEPIIGRRLYLSGDEQWRISTPVATIEIKEAIF